MPECYDRENDTKGSPVMKKLLPIFLLLLLLGGCFECKHENISPATCTADSVCLDCEAVIAPALGHTEVFTDCEKDVTCAVCSEIVRPGTAHTPGAPATCTEEQRCTVCDKVLAPVIDHTPAAEASCTEDILCAVCSQVVIPAAHEPGPEANCTDDQLCMRCGEVLQSYLGHTANGNTCGTCGVTMALAPDAPAGSYIHESVSGVHYNNTFEPYYSGAVRVYGDYALEYFTLGASGSPEWANAVNAFAARFPNIQVSAMIVPKSSAYNSVDENRSHDSQRDYIAATYDMLNGVIGVDAMSVMDQHSGEYMFYRTDHHWTSLGAYYASVAFCRANGIIPRQLSTYETVVQTDYIGSLYYFCPTKEYSLLTNPDYTVYHLPKAQYDMTIYGNSLPMLKTTTNDYSSGFICSDNPLTFVTTDNQTGRNLLIFKESYGNCFAPFMADYFDNIVIADMRYFDDSLDYIVSTYGITHALIMNNAQAVGDFAEMLGSVLTY